MTLLNLDSKLLFNVLYSSYVLEYFTKREAPNFLKKCCRALKKMRMIRLVVPAIDGSTRKPDSLFLEAIK